MTTIQYKSEHIGKGGISARVVAHSKSAYNGQEIITWEYEAPKCILAEINTHRQFSRNAQSSRAVPVSKVIDQIKTNPVTPIYWGSNQAGMVAGEEIDNQIHFDFFDREGSHDRFVSKEEAWQYSATQVADLMQSWEEAGYHKQIVNRIGEAFTFVRGVITATEIDNFFHLRVHPAADPFMKELAECMYQAYTKSEAEVLYEGEWHTPYVEHYRFDDGDGVTHPLNYVGGWSESTGEFKLKSTEVFTLERAKQISAAACAQVSFRKLDLSDETVDRVYSRLVDDETPHASCVEHQATPMKYADDVMNKLQYMRKEGGVTHLDKEGNLWSGNFKHWIQNRKLIPNESCNNYVRKEV